MAVAHNSSGDLADRAPPVPASMVDPEPRVVLGDNGSGKRQSSSGASGAARWRPADVSAFLDAVPQSSRPAAVTSDPYAYLDLEPDFAWQSAASGSATVIAGNDDERPAWLQAAERKRRRHRLVSAASWLVSGTVAIAIVALAAVMMLGVPRSMALLKEVAGDGVAPSSAALTERAAAQGAAAVDAEQPAGSAEGGASSRAAASEAAAEAGIAAEPPASGPSGQQ